MNIDSHYIPKFLTKPWIHADGSFRVFDTQTNSIGNVSAGRFFAQTNLFPDWVEKWFRNKYEKVIAQEREAICTGSGNFENWNKYRALYLLMIFQAPRVLAAEGKANVEPHLMSLTGSNLDRFIAACEEQWRVIRLQAPRGDRLFFTSSGIFPFPVRTTNRVEPYGIALGLPLRYDTTLALAPIDIDLQKTLEMSSQEGYLMRFSVGTRAHSGPILIPTRMKETSPAAASEYFSNSKGANTEAIDAIVKLRDLLRPFSPFFESKGE